MSFATTTNADMATNDTVDTNVIAQEDAPTTTTSSANPAKKGHHRRTSSLLPSLNSLGSFLASARGLTGSNNDGQGSSTLPTSSSGGLSTDAELIISHPTPTEWADDSNSPVKQRFHSASSAARVSRSTETQLRASPRNLSEQVRFRGQPRRLGRSHLFNSHLSHRQSFIAFPSPTSPTMSTVTESERPLRSSSASRTSSAASIARHSDPAAAARLVYSPEPSASTTSSSAYTPATSVRYSPAPTPKTLPDQAPLQSPSPPRPSEATIQADAPSQQGSTSRSAQSYQTLPRSFAASTVQGSSKEVSEQGSVYGRTASFSGATDKLNEALESDDKITNRQAGFRARSINSIRGLAAAWVPARFAPTSQPSSSASSSSSNDESSSLGGHSPRRRDGMALTTTAGAESKTMVRHGTDSVKRPVKLDRRRLDKAVSLAVEAAQAAEEDERLWEEKRANKIASAAKARPALKGAWPSSSPSSNEDSRQLTRFGTNGIDADTSLTLEEEDEDEDQDHLGFSLDLYISSLGYLISAISDKEAPGLSSKQKQDIKQRLEEGMSKLGFDAKAELEKAEAIKRELELEREKLQLQQQHSASPTTAHVIHHHYHTAVPANSSYFGVGAGDFSRAHAAAKASSRGSSSLAGKISSSVLDIGLHIGAGALSALSANLSAIAPRGVGGGSSKASSTSAKRDGEGMEDPRITDLDNDEDLPSPSESQHRADASPSQPGSGAATPRTAWTRSINQNNKQWELAVAFASTAASALASSLGTVARNEPAPPSSPCTSTAVTTGPLTPEQQQQLAQYGYLPSQPPHTQGETAEDRLILLSASLARSLKRSPLPSQLYQLLRQLVSILAAIDAKYSLTEKGTQMAVRETSRAMRFVRRHDLHLKAVRVAWAAAEAAVAALEAYRDEKGWMEQQRITGGGATPVYGASPPKESRAIEARQTLKARMDDAEAQILAAAAASGEKGKVREKLGQRA
ncbi:uncharacterized protein UBRO_04388 [Ustilago bromivora]|uniref:Uncharacterized protein n=1 Tax=Ustilago bromivora TaxID=307758 RepID=A0A1K0G3V2_9BASI|nr:uncharacterized protein UBRO_04388 [Ustilago bromivora]SYW77154.1 uncharacterized protein UBRO2_01777 [Ustilago bromivora]